jgi:hypothetical protein
LQSLSRSILAHRGILVVVSTLALLLTLSIGLTQAQGPVTGGAAGPQASTSPAADVPFGIPVQGRLTDAGGVPVNGSPSVTFSLYNVDVGGAQLCSDINTVDVVNGLFSTVIWGNCGSAQVNGQALYLGIQVGADPEMTPRQSILPVPYAVSLRPGADISGTVAGNPILQVENSAPDGRGLRGYTTSATGINYGVVGRSYSPDGYGGYFANNAGGYALQASGGVSITVNAGSAKQIAVGDRYRDNAIVAWAKVSSAGSLSQDFGVASVTKDPGAGSYLIVLDSRAVEAATLIPMAIAEIDTAPTTAAGLMIVSINQLSANIFDVYINNGSGTPVDNDFVVMVTAR